jgi:hypothetical protein
MKLFSNLTPFIPLSFVRRGGRVKTVGTDLQVCPPRTGLKTCPYIHHYQYGTDYER